MTRTVRVAVGVLLASPVSYVAWWHVAFVLMFRSRGDAITADLYTQYVSEFLFGRGFEIAFFIQLAAVALTLPTLFVIWTTLAVRTFRTRARGAPPGSGLGA